MKLHFTKMQGAGNDYIYVNCLTAPLPDPEKLAIRLSNRHYGIGSDGLVLILPSETADFRMRMFNADGTEAQMCGNASRCIARYLWEHNLLTSNDFTLETLAGIKHLHLDVRNGNLVSVSVDMGTPLITEETLSLNIGGHPLELTCVDMGNPHAVLFVPNVDNAEVRTLGPAIENHPHFPHRTNVEFVQILNNSKIRMRVWERGSGETLACGTGACAATVASVIKEHLNSELSISLPGGELHTHWDKALNHITLTGLAETVFEGTITIEE